MISTIEYDKLQQVHNYRLIYVCKNGETPCRIIPAIYGLFFFNSSLLKVFKRKIRAYVFPAQPTGDVQKYQCPMRSRTNTCRSLDVGC